MVCPRPVRSDLSARVRRHDYAITQGICEPQLQSLSYLEVPERLLAERSNVMVSRELEEDTVPRRQRATGRDADQSCAHYCPRGPTARSFEQGEPVHRRQWREALWRQVELIRKKAVSGNRATAVRRPIAVVAICESLRLSDANGAPYLFRASASLIALMAGM
jgi:hypothetical protein